MFNADPEAMRLFLCWELDGVYLSL